MFFLTLCMIIKWEIQDLLIFVLFHSPLDALFIFLKWTLFQLKSLLTATFLLQASKLKSENSMQSVWNHMTAVWHRLIFVYIWLCYMLTLAMWKVLFPFNERKNTQNCKTVWFFTWWFLSPFLSFLYIPRPPKKKELWKSEVDCLRTSVIKLSCYFNNIRN